MSQSGVVKTNYRYESWFSTAGMEEVLEDLEELYKLGWKVASHSHSSYGISVILKRMEKNEKEKDQTTLVLEYLSNPNECVNRR